MSEEDRLVMSEEERMNAKKALLRAMIKLKLFQAKATGQDVADFIKQINNAEKIEKGSSMKLFEGTDKLWKCQLLTALNFNEANFGEKGSSLRKMLSMALAKWATTTKSAKDKKAGRDEYARVLAAVGPANVKNKWEEEVALEEAI
jgi:hypothetical protein